MEKEWRGIGKKSNILYYVIFDILESAPFVPPKTPTKRKDFAALDRSLPPPPKKAQKRNKNIKNKRSKHFETQNRIQLFLEKQKENWGPTEKRLFVL
jgi:hypothetical protein